MASLSPVLSSRDSDAGNEEVFDTAPTSPEMPLSAASSPGSYFSLPASPIIARVLVPDTPRSKKKVSWSPLPSKMDRADRTPTRSTRPSQSLRIGALSLLLLPRSPKTPQSPPSYVTPTQHGRHKGSPRPIQSRCPQQGRDPCSPTRLFRGDSLQQAGHYEPLPGNPMLPLDIFADGFLKTKEFEVICTLAMNIACMIPIHAPPQVFVSLDLTPMHPWFESLVAIFTECFAKRLRDCNVFPQRPAAYAAETAITIEEDHDAFELELVAHVNAIFRGFNTEWALRAFGNSENLLIDTTEPHAGMAAMAIRDTIEKPSFPPKANWKVGETLHPFYKAHLRRFRGGVIRILEDRPGDSWMLTMPEQLERGVAGFEEYYIARVRHKILVYNGET